MTKWNVTLACNETLYKNSLHFSSGDSLFSWRDVSAPWLESTCCKWHWLGMIWKGTHVSIEGLTAVIHTGTEIKNHEVKRTDCRAQRQVYCKAQICCTEGSQEYIGLHNSQMGKVSHNQDSFQSLAAWPNWAIRGEGPTGLEFDSCDLYIAT